MKAYGVVLGLSLFASPALAQNEGDLTAGGLAPPDAIESEGDQQSNQQSTEAELEKAEAEDSGRGLEFFWLGGEIGATHLGLHTFKADDLIDAAVDETTQTGLTYGGGLGLRFVFITVGARFRMASLPDWRLWTLNAEGGLRIPLGAFEPYFTLGGGYASLAAAADGPKAAGLNVRGGFGLDIYLSEMFSLGGNLTGELLVLSRSAVDGAVAGTAYAGDGSGIGAAGTLTLVAGLHF
jgi:hypothetical protein